MKITLSAPWAETKNDKTVTHKPDTTLDVDRITAGNLITLGLARAADDDSKEG